MRFRISCTATSELLHCGIQAIFISTMRPTSKAESKLQGDYDATLAHPHDPGVPGLPAQCQRTVPAQRSRTGRYRPRSYGHSARCRRNLRQLISVQPPDERITPALLRALSCLAFSLTRFLPQISLRNLRKLDCYANRHP